MRNSSLQETVIIILTLIPFIYLGLVYNSLPDTLPMHWNAKGEIDRMGSKQELWLIPILLTGLMYVILKYVPKLDPKGQIKKMGNKFGHLRVAITLFQTALAVGIIYMSTTYKDGDTGSPSWIFMLIGLLFIVIGNYMPAMKPNYFVGIRTPWTLDNENVWRKTHRVGAILFIISGVIILTTSLLLNFQIAFYATIGTAFVIVAWTFIYSYTLYKKLQ